MDSGPTHHQHGRSLENASRNKKGAGVLDGIRIRRKQHNVAAYTEDCAPDDEVSSVLDLVRVVGCQDDDHKPHHVGWDGKQLGGGGGVLHAGDDGGEEEGKALLMGLSGFVLGHFPELMGERRDSRITEQAKRTR